MSRWKKITLALLCIVAIITVAAYVFRHAIGGLIVASVIGDFDPAKASPPPDYALDSSWAALPSKDDAADRRPSDLVEVDSPVRALVDVFYIHPTGYNGLENWNATVGKESTHAIPTSLMLAGQASAFNGCGQVYAPAYRQASLFAYVQPQIAPQRNDGYQALDLAYTDIARAFDYFIEHHSKGRPFIITSHSQGSVHALRLLAEKIDATPLYPRLIAAYVLGCSMPMDYFDRVYKDIVPCTAPTQVGCLIAWDTIRENGWVPPLSIHRYPTGWESMRGKPLYSVNPLTWTTTGERAPATANAGALVAAMVPISVNPDACELKGIEPQFTWAQCHGGRLWVAEQTEGPFYDRFGIYHLFDYGLFWMNIRENARARAEAYLQANGQRPTA